MAIIIEYSTTINSRINSLLGLTNSYDTPNLALKRMLTFGKREHARSNVFSRPTFNVCLEIL